MPRVRTLAAVAAAAACSAASARPAAVTLNVGDPAPPLAVGKWVKGEPVRAIEPGKAYVVEFWATWCGPCRATIPHLSDLAKKHADVVFIGQNVFEQDDAKIGPFVAEMGPKMDYRVATDDKSKTPDGAMAETWMKAAGQNGIPTAFLVGRDGKIAWIGHPQALGPVLEQVEAGAYDPAAAAARKAKDADLARRLRAALAAKDADGVVKATDEMIAQRPDSADALLAFQFQVLSRAGRADAARAKAEKVVAAASQPAALDQVARTLAARPAPSKDDLALARRAADKACGLTQSAQPLVLDTSARVYAAAGQWDQAVQTQTRAVAAADGEVKADLRRTLDAYAKQQLPAAE